MEFCIIAAFNFSLLSECILPRKKEGKCLILAIFWQAAFPSQHLWILVGFYNTNTNTESEVKIQITFLILRRDSLSVLWLIFSQELQLYFKEQLTRMPFYCKWFLLKKGLELLADSKVLDFRIWNLIVHFFSGSDNCKFGDWSVWGVCNKGSQQRTREVVQTMRWLLFSIILYHYFHNYHYYYYFYYNYYYYYYCYHDLPWFADYKGFRSTQMPKEGDPHSLLQMICNPCQPILLVDWPTQLTSFVLHLIFVCVHLYLCCKKYQSEKIVRNIGGITHNTN